jgi:hypothetical protein
MMMTTMIYTTFTPFTAPQTCTHPHYNCRWVSEEEYDERARSPRVALWQWFWWPFVVGCGRKLAWRYGNNYLDPTGVAGGQRRRVAQPFVPPPPCLFHTENCE